MAERVGPWKPIGRTTTVAVWTTEGKPELITLCRCVHCGRVAGVTDLDFEKVKDNSTCGGSCVVDAASLPNRNVLESFAEAAHKGQRYRDPSLSKEPGLVVTASVATPVMPPIPPPLPVAEPVPPSVTKPASRRLGLEATPLVPRSGRRYVELHKRELAAFDAIVANRPLKPPGHH